MQTKKKHLGHILEEQDEEEEKLESVMMAEGKTKGRLEDITPPANPEQTIEDARAQAAADVFFGTLNVAGDYLHKL
jgi:hypothetical protein